MANFIRVDDRLIHGQIITKWAGYLNVKNIVVIDDNTAKNNMLKSIMMMSVPKIYKTVICSYEEAKNIIQKLSEKSENTLILIRFPSMLNNLVNNGIRPDLINIGNVSRKGDENKFEITHNIFLTENDIQILENLHKQGMKITFQLVPDTPCYIWSKERQKYFKD
ncbi:PTS sugar transporter subunit IIB [Thermoanaerobacterium thermosaccharolyticum]|uniref:PTS sugar transporter subunit IIB n=1 Tax=Thermoanaerobacterium thermosaccharolyticum TaxID=1517 RepID=UPI003D287FC0